MIQFPKMSTRILYVYDRIRSHEGESFTPLLRRKGSFIRAGERSCRAPYAFVCSTNAPFEIADFRALRQTESELPVPRCPLIRTVKNGSAATPRVLSHRMALFIRAFPDRLYSRVAHERVGAPHLFAKSLYRFVSDSPLATFAIDED